MQILPDKEKNNIGPKHVVEGRKKCRRFGNAGKTAWL